MARNPLAGQTGPKVPALMSPISNHRRLGGLVRHLSDPDWRVLTFQDQGAAPMAALHLRNPPPARPSTLCFGRVPRLPDSPCGHCWGGRAFPRGAAILLRGDTKRRMAGEPVSPHLTGAACPARYRPTSVGTAVQDGRAPLSNTPGAAILAAFPGMRAPRSERDVGWPIWWHVSTVMNVLRRRDQPLLGGHFSST